MFYPDPVVVNDNWKDTQQVFIENSEFPPGDDFESAIIIALDPGNYTAKVTGKNDTTGIALVEVYDLGTASINYPPPPAELVNISTRGFAGTENEVMIGGFIISGQTTRVIVRAIGPSLNDFVPGPVQDPTLELNDVNGNRIVFNDNWMTREDGSSQEDEIRATTLPPSNVWESGVF